MIQLLVFSSTGAELDFPNSKKNFILDSRILSDDKCLKDAHPFVFMPIDLQYLRRSIEDLRLWKPAILLLPNVWKTSSESSSSMEFWRLILRWRQYRGEDTDRGVGV